MLNWWLPGCMCQDSGEQSKALGPSCFLCIRDDSFMSCACQLITYTLAVEENVCNVRVCACCNHFPIT